MQVKTGRLRVMLVDDHKILRQGLTSMLSWENNIEVVGQATNGQEAVDIASKVKPDVIVMDVSMPGMNGEDATRQIKQALPNVRVIALSMFEETEMIKRMHSAGVECYILKSAPAEDLLAAIRGKT